MLDSSGVINFVPYNVILAAEGKGKGREINVYPLRMSMCILIVNSMVRCRMLYSVESWTSLLVVLH